MRLIVPLYITTAAGTALSAYWTPPSGEVYRLVAIRETPRATVATDGTNYNTRTVKVGANSVATAKTTNSSGGAAMTAGTVSEFASISGDLSKNRITNDAPLSVAVTHTGSGALVNADYSAEVELVH